MLSHILILGAGPMALTAALALHKDLPSPAPKITIYEVRPSPSTIGGAVNLTPKALRYLHHLGVLSLLDCRGHGAECKTIELFDLYSGAKHAAIDFRGLDGRGEGVGKEGSKFFARRVTRSEILDGMLELVERTEGIDVVFGKKVTAIEESNDGVRLAFDDGDVVTGDCLLGCDGIHSAARSLLVDPEREPTYSGISIAMATATLESGSSLPPWSTTGLVSTRRGSLMCSYFEPLRTRQYIAAAMEVADVGSREGWKVKGGDQEAIRRDLLERFASETMPVPRQMLEGAGDWTLYPVYALPPGGKWISEKGRVLLLGDAAHAMPPQGESTGICIEDAIVLSRAMMQQKTKSLSSVFRAYEEFRRPHTDKAVQEATWRFETVKDKGWLFYQLILRSTSWFLWWTAQKRDADFAEDLSEMVFEIPS